MNIKIISVISITAISILTMGMISSAGHTSPTIFHLNNLVVWYTPEVERYCPKGSRACYLPYDKKIICTAGDWYACGHELCHATFGDANHERECILGVKYEE